jgi:cyclic dehypoxanthinyl futalosine synthase
MSSTRLRTPPASEPTGTPPLGRRDILFGAVGGAMVLIAIVLLLAGGERDTGAGPAAGAVPAISVQEPVPGAVTTAPLRIVFHVGEEMRAGPTGWGVGELHIHLDLDGREFMPTARDIEPLGGGLYRWTVPRVAPASGRCVSSGRVPTTCRWRRASPARCGSAWSDAVDRRRIERALLRLRPPRRNAASLAWSGSHAAWPGDERPARRLPFASTAATLEPPTNETLERERGEKPMATQTTVGTISEKVESGGRISVDEAAVLWRDASDEELKRLAGVVRARYHEPDHATYVVMRIINYTNVCVAQCDYCAFYVLPNQEGGYVLTREDVFAKIDELLELGGDLVGFNGGFNPKLPLHYYCDLFRAVRDRYGDRAEFYALTIAEMMYLADRAKLSYLDTCRELRAAGVHWITGGGSEILTEDFRRRHSKFKYTVEQYFEAQKAVVDAGLRTTATMVIGFDETLEERLEHLQRTRDFQDRTGGLFSFLCWTYKPYGTALAGQEIAPGEYHRHIALSRIFLDNVKHMRTSVLTLNEDAFRALEYGADDFDLPIEDEVTQKAGAVIDRDLERLLDVPRALGFRVTYRHAERPEMVASA